ncbi:MAG: DUF4176 domain-containing protein [Bacillota bacterium]|nr:DUF4176 domain-containing protein [Bacillota bacterium]
MKYYPLGTVVTLKNGNRPLMIYGRKQIQAGSNLLWDYVACLYPEGNLGEDYNIFFQQEEIGTVHFSGYQSAAEQRMQQVLNQAG